MIGTLSHETPVFVQGITGRMGRTHAALMRAYGTNIVGGTSTRTDVKEAAGVPVFALFFVQRSFIGDLQQNHHSMAIVRAIITLGHSLHVPVLAEGVETESQRAFLQREGCDDVQGYLTGRPLPIAAYADAIGRPAAREIRASNN